MVEYILEHEDQNENMAGIAENLGISKSALSKHTKRMVEKGLLEKYHTSDNQKNIIIRVSDYGRQIYSAYAEYTYENAFRKMFRLLEDIPDEYLDRFTQAMEIASQLAAADKEPEQKVELIKIEKS